MIENSYTPEDVKNIIAGGDEGYIFRGEQHKDPLDRLFIVNPNSTDPYDRLLGEVASADGMREPVTNRV